MAYQVLKYDDSNDNDNDKDKNNDNNNDDNGGLPKPDYLQDYF